MDSFCIVFPVPARYFDNMAEVCSHLHGFYEKEPVHPRYVVTMKRPYCFENARGEYGEFESGDRFLIYCGKPEHFHTGALFNNSFPSPQLLKEVAWEGISFQVGIVVIDHMLEKTLADMGVGLHPYSENSWLTVEEYAGFMSIFQAHRKDICK